MYSLFYKLITQTAALKTKINKLNNYWTYLKQYSITTSSVHSNCRINADDCWVVIQGNILEVQISHTVTAAISSGTSVKRVVCTISFTDTEHLLDWTQVPLNRNGLNGSTGGICTYAIYDWTTDEEGTYTAKIMLCGTAASSMATGKNFIPRFTCIVARNFN